MNDARAGTLFAAQFSGSALGALLVGRDYFSSIMTGYVLLVGSAVSLSYFGNSLAVLFFLIFGLGLGLTMTATSMFTSTRFVDRRGSALSMLNAYWALGAVLCPLLASLWIRRWAAEKLFLALAIVEGVIFILIVVDHRRFSAHSALAPSVRHGQLPFALIVIVAFIAFLYVGVEVSVSGWMMSYVHRLNVSVDLFPPIAVSCFWIALLCGRAVAPLLLRTMSEAHLLSASVAGALINVTLLLLNRNSFAIILSAAALGLTLGPVYPLCVARVLALAHDSVNTKWIFAISGFGGALLPWLTGRLSAYEGSLSVGLVVPLLALGVMFILLLYSSQAAPTAGSSAVQG